MLEIGKTYFWKRSDGFLWNGVQRWWEYFVEVSGLNGSGGYWLTEKARWNGGSPMPHLDQIKTLSWEESKKLEEEVGRATQSKGGQR